MRLILSLFICFICLISYAQEMKKDSVQIKDYEVINFEMELKKFKDSVSEKIYPVVLSKKYSKLDSNLIIENTDNVINKLSSKYNLEIIDYTVAPVFMEKNKKGAHQWFIEFKNIPSEKINIAQIIDEEL